MNISCLFTAVADPPSINPLMSILPLVLVALIGGGIGALVAKSALSSRSRKSRGNLSHGFWTGFVFAPLFLLVTTWLLFLDPLLLFVPFIGMCVGGAIGQSRGRTGEGLVIGFFLGPIGWIVLIFGPNPKQQMEKQKMDDLFQSQIDLQRAQLEQIKKMQSRESPENISKQPPSHKMVRLAKNGVDIGEIEIEKLKIMLEANVVCGDDFYFDLKTNNWVPIQSHPLIKL